MKAFAKSTVGVAGVLGVICLFSFQKSDKPAPGDQPEDKTYTVTLPISEWRQYYQAIEGLQFVAGNPRAQSGYVFELKEKGDSLKAKIQNQIAEQVFAEQLKAEKEKAKADSAKKANEPVKK